MIREVPFYPIRAGDITVADVLMGLGCGTVRPPSVNRRELIIGRSIEKGTTPQASGRARASIENR